MGRANIAIVDDSHDVRAMLKFVLNEWYSVETYSGAREAFDGMRKTRPDVLIVDMLLADSHGLELGRWMRADPLLRSVPIIGLSGLPYDSQISTEVTRFLSKPVDIDELLDAIEEATGKTVQTPRPRSGRKVG